MTLISRLTAAAFAVVVALLVVFAAAPAEGQSIRVTPDVVRGAGGDFDEAGTVRVTVNGLPADQRWVSVRVEGEYDTEFTRGHIVRNRTRCFDINTGWFSRNIDLTGGAGSREYRVPIGFHNTFCLFSVAGSAKVPVAILGAPRLRIEYPRINADGETSYELDVQTFGFEGFVNVEMHPQRSHPRCGLAGGDLNALFLGAPHRESNLWRKWRNFVPQRITTGDIAPQSNVECVFLASFAGEPDAYASVFFHAVDGPPTPPPPPLVDQRDKRTLQTLFNETGGRNWTNSRNWNTDRPLSEWYGVETIELVGIGTAVSGIRLPNNNLTGEIPRELNDLGSFFDTLVLNGNRLTGEIPRELARFENTINPQQGGVNLCVEGRSGCGDPPPPDDLRITLSAADTTLSEGEETTLTARANRAVTEDVTLLIRMTGGTAGESDIERTSLQITSGSREASTYLRAVSDNLTEGTETATLTAERYPDGTRYGSVTITILDDTTTPPPPPGDLEITLSTNDSWHITEGPYYGHGSTTRNYDSTTRLVLTANRPVSTHTRIELVVVGGSASHGDYDIFPSLSTGILPGETTAGFIFHAEEDQISEGSETVVIEGRFGDGRTTNRQTITIWDAAVPALPFLGALLLAAGLCVMGLRKVRR